MKPTSQIIMDGLIPITASLITSILLIGCKPQGENSPQTTEDPSTEDVRAEWRGKIKTGMSLAEFEEILDGMDFSKQEHESYLLLEKEIPNEAQDLLSATLGREALFVFINDRLVYAHHCDVPQDGEDWSVAWSLGSLDGIYNARFLLFPEEHIKAYKNDLDEIRERLPLTLEDFHAQLSEKGMEVKQLQIGIRLGGMLAFDSDYVHGYVWCEGYKCTWHLESVWRNFPEEDSKRMYDDLRKAWLTGTGPQAKQKLMYLQPMFWSPDELEQ